LTILKNKKLAEDNGILICNEFDEVTKKVVEFYKDKPFPNYNDNDNKITILSKGDQSYLKNLKKLVGYNKKILEVGCGTGQYSNYFAIGTNNMIYALDPAYNSIKLAKNFSDKNNIKNIKYINGSVFDDIFEKETFDLVFSSGVLHHTKDTYLGFKKCTELVKKNGYLLVGLYNLYSRFSLNKLLYKIFGEKGVIFDPILKDKKQSKASMDAWIKDQYDHPVERSHSIEELLSWFKKHNFEPISGIPNINNIDMNKINDEIQDKNSYKLNSKFNLFFTQIKTNFNLLGKDGALFCILGRKKDVI
jgi:2-polyprenyl-3-methyl-5-hydroxy-6-metoxy-1,4-benzoquinol methylase